MFCNSVTFNFASQANLIAFANTDNIRIPKMQKEPKMSLLGFFLQKLLVFMMYV